MAFILTMVNVTVAARFSPLFECIYLLEIFLSLLILGGTPLAVYTVMGTSPLHRNLRLTVASVIVHFSLQVVARLTLLYYHIYRLPLNGEFNHDLLFISANLTREAIAGFSIAIPAALAFERSCATALSSWYEKESISTIIVFIAPSLVLEVFAWSNAFLLFHEVYTIQFNVIVYGIAFLLGALIFQYVLMLNVAYYKKLKKLSISVYCLSRAYQIRENINVMQMLRKLAFPTLIFNIPLFALISIHIFLPNEERLELVRNVAIALFDLWIVVYAISFGLLVYNLEPRLQESLRRFFVAAYLLDKYDEITGRIRKLTISPSPNNQNETDIYFSMLSKDLYSERKHSTLSKITIIEV